MHKIHNIRRIHTDYMGFKWNGDIDFPEEFQDLGFTEICDSSSIYVDTIYGSKKIKIGDWILKSKTDGSFSVMYKENFDKAMKIVPTIEEGVKELLEDITMAVQHAPFCNHPFKECSCMSQSHFSLHALAKRAEAILNTHGQRVEE